MTAESQWPLISLPHPVCPPAGSPGKSGPRKARQAAKRRPKGHKLPKAIAGVDVGQASWLHHWCY